MRATAPQPVSTPAAPRRNPVVVALGRDALLGRAEPAQADVRRRNVAAAVESIADLAADHDVVVAHGNELGGMIGYLLEQGLEAALPGREIATVRMRGVVDADELRTIRSLVAAGVLVICAGMPGVVESTEPPRGVEDVGDRDLAAALLATCLGADALLMLADPDADAVQRDGGVPDARAPHTATPEELWRLPLAAGSMAPKVLAACRFVEATGGMAAIGALADARALLNGRCGTIVRASHDRQRSDREAARDRLCLLPAVVARSIEGPPGGGLPA